ncbi:MAG: cytidylate kinase family protein [Tannerellaceae bacterium]|jgi:cytidylate kinase|nr:cytidylate kinase family protein [Tannerellaceae bacterium]
MKIAVSGELGSGKTVLSNKLSEALGLEVISVGKIQRRLAAECGMTTLEFNKYMETHPEIDRKCDDMVAMYGKEKRSLILDSRMAWYFVPDSFKIHLLADTLVAAQRIYADNARKNEYYNNVEEAEKKLVERKKSEALRFRQQYGVDVDDYNNYDLVADTSFSPPGVVFDIVLECLDKWNRHQPFNRLYLSPESFL